MAFVRMNCPVTLPNGERLSVEVAETLDQMREGLRGRTSLGPNEAMLFVYSKPGFHQFTMEGVRIPLDMVWLDSAFRICEFRRNVEPGARYLQGGKKISAYALELPAGSIDRFGLKLDQQLTIGGFIGGFNG
jgi:uncharacterized protein